MEIANVMLVLIVLGSLLLLVGFLYFFFIGPVKKTEPQIISLKEPIKMIGVSKRTSLKTIFKDAVELGKEYKSIKDQGLIKNKMEPWAFVAISKDFIGQDSWEYLMGDVVNSLDTIPANLKSFEIPAIMYAVFNVKPKSKFAWGITIGRMKKYIYTAWLPNSIYESDCSVIGDFEYHDKRSEEKRPEIDLYVAIKVKKQ